MDDTAAAELEGVAHRLKRLRLERDITLTALARTTGVSKSTLSRLETGQRRPTLELLLALSRVYRVPLDELVGAPRSHDGSEWIYVLSGRMRLVLGDEDFVLGPGEVAEFDTKVPHWFGSAGEEPAELLSIFARPGERIKVRTEPPRR